MKSKIIIFDDNDERLNSICVLLQMCDDLECVGKFKNASYAIEAVETTQPDLIIMDIDMPGGDGITGTKIIKEKFPDIPIIIQTVFEENEKIFDALKAGANGYILKKTTPDKLLSHLRDAIDGGAPMTRSIAVKVLSFFKEQSIEDNYNLSKREKMVLKLLVDGYSYKMIAEEYNITYNTVCNHIANIYQKLHVNSATEAVSIAIKKRLV